MDNNKSNLLVCSLPSLSTDAFVDKPLIVLQKMLHFDEEPGNAPQMYCGGDTKQMDGVPGDRFYTPEDYPQPYSNRVHEGHYQQVPDAYSNGGSEEANICCRWDVGKSRQSGICHIFAASYYL